MPAPELGGTASLGNERAYRRDRWLVLAGMATIALLSWAYMVTAANPGRAPAAMTGPPAWDPGLLALSVPMWGTMMVAMMLPSATPVVLSFTRVQHRRGSHRQAVRRTWLFVTGYLIAWTLFDLAAAGIQWVLHSLGLMSSAMGRAGPFLAGGFLITTGLFQWSRLKDACLTGCRSPLNFLLNHWRKGGAGALTMGLHHGVYCIGCCWLLMLLMFVGGVMNLLWMAGITLYVLAEKMLPGMQALGRLTGALLIGAGVWLLLTAL